MQQTPNILGLARALAPPALYTTLRKGSGPEEQQSGLASNLAAWGRCPSPPLRGHRKGELRSTRNLKADPSHGIRGGVQLLDPYPATYTRELVETTFVYRTDRQQKIGPAGKPFSRIQESYTPEEQGP